VDVHHPQPVDFDGTSFLDASADSLDLEDFLLGVRQVAEELAEAGDSDELPLRMAKARGVMGRRTTAPLGAPAPGGAPAGGKRAGREQASDEKASGGQAGGERTGDGCARVEPVGDAAGRGSHLPRAPKALQIFVREAAGSEDAEPRLFGEVPRWGVVSQGVLDRWMGSHRAKFTRVVDLARSDAVDDHDPPAWMRSVVELRDRHCVAPGCMRPAAECDKDHIVPYDPTGPPGQTSPENLACLCRRHHLLKTHAGWSYYRDRRGSYVWTSPQGRVFVVESEGTEYLIGQVA
jgi:hypothetical protein